MLAGRAAFSGKDVTDILAVVIRAEPEWSSLPANLHWRLKEVLERCLKKDAKDRYHDISDVKADIQRVLTDPAGGRGQPAAADKAQRRHRVGLPWVAVIAALCIIIAGVAVWRLKPAPPPEPRQVVRLDYELPKDQQLSLYYSTLALSPEGRKLVYSTNNGLYLRPVDELNAKLIAGTEGDTQQPFFSPDGKWIGFVSSGSLKKISINGGAPVTLCAVTQPSGASWCEDNTIVYGEWDIGMLSMDGARERKTLLHHEYLEINPKISPDGVYVAYTSGESGRNEVYVRPFPNVDKGKWQASTNGGANALWSPNGRELYYLSENNSVMALAVETKLAFSLGTPKPLFQSRYVGSLPGEGTPWDISPDGRRFLMMNEAQSTSGAQGGSRKINIVVNWLEELKQRVGERPTR